MLYKTGSLAEFKYWMREFIYVCKVALKNGPRLLEVLGIQVLSDGYRRQKIGDAGRF